MYVRRAGGGRLPLLNAPLVPSKYMTLIIAPEIDAKGAANFERLKYLIDRFNRPGLEGLIALGRTTMLRDYQLRLDGHCCGEVLTVVGASFDPSLLTDPNEQERLTLAVSTFLLRVKHLHQRQCGGSAATADTPSSKVSAT